jgi:hypothetical protein
MARRSSQKKDTWRINEVVGATRTETAKRVLLASIFVRDQIKRSLNTSNVGGTEPSDEGEPPHKGTGDLQRSITEQVTQEGPNVVGRVGTNAPHARRLELGFTGTDSAGRTYRQGPRPFMQPGLANNRAQVKKILGAK